MAGNMEISTKTVRLTDTVYWKTKRYISENRSDTTIQEMINQLLDESLDRLINGSKKTAKTA